MSNATDNFDSLWANLREQVIAARTNQREGVNTDFDGPFQSKYGGRVAVASGDEDGATLYVSNQGARMHINCQPSDLYTIAAHCIAAAMEVEEAQAEAQAVRPSQSHAA